jgi:DNA-binding MarR family transcriptional regulator
MPGRLWAHDGVRRDRVAERVAEREVAAERPVLGREHDCRAVLDEVVVQGVRVIAAEPDGDAPTEVFRVPQVDHGRADGERDGLGVEDDGARRAMGGRLQTDDVRVEGSRGFDVGDLDADEVWSDEMGHDDLLLADIRRYCQCPDKYKDTDMSSVNAGAGMGDPYGTVGFALKQAQHALRTRLDGELRGIGLTMPQYAVLACLQAKAGASNATLARSAFVTPQTMQAILVALERPGFVERSAHPDHGRVLRTELTVSGRAILERASGIVADAEERVRTATAPLDPRVVTATLLRIAEALR